MRPVLTSADALLRSCRLRIGRTEEDVASVAGVSARTIKRWELGHTRPKPSAVPALRQAYGLTLSESAELERLLGLAADGEI